MSVWVVRGRKWREAGALPLAQIVPHPRARYSSVHAERLDNQGWRRGSDAGACRSCGGVSGGRREPSRWRRLYPTRGRDTLPCMPKDWTTRDGAVVAMLVTAGVGALSDPPQWIIACFLVLTSVAAYVLPRVASRWRHRRAARGKVAADKRLAAEPEAKQKPLPPALA